MEFKINNFIENNRDIDNIQVTNIFQQDNENANYWIKRGDINCKNLNYERAFLCYEEALSFECTTNELYYCYRQLYSLSGNLYDKKKYLYKIFSIKEVKKTKKEIFMLLTIDILIYFEENPNILIPLLIFLFLFFKGVNSN